MASNVIDVGVRIVPRVDEKFVSTFELAVQQLENSAHVDIIDPDAVANIQRVQREMEDLKGSAASVAKETQKAFGGASVQPAVAGAKELAGEFLKTEQALKDVGETNKRALAQMITSGEKGSASYRQMVEETKKAEKEARLLDDALKEVDRELQDDGSKKGRFDAFQFNQTLQAAQALSAGVQELAQPFTALDTATAQLRTLGDEAAAMAPNLREAAISMSKDLPFAAAQLQTAMFDALASGVKGGEDGLKAFADTAAKLAVGGGSDLSAATGLLAGQLNAYGKGAEDAAKFSDIFFNTVNFGVTSVSELSSTLANVIPTAAGLGVEIENVGGALAVMTSKGIPTAQSTTKLNALLLELAKPAAQLAPILKEAGVSLESLKQDDLPTTLGKVQAALEKTGKSAVQVFSSSEAGAAFQTLAGDLDGFRQTFEDVRDTTGSAQNAYEEMSKSVQTQTDQMISRVQAFVIEGIDMIGPGFVAAASGAAQIAPMVTTLVGLKDIFPVEAAGAFAKRLITETVPALFKQVAASIASAGAKTAEAVATGGATVAQTALNVAMAASPIFLLIGGVGLLVGAFALFSGGAEDLDVALGDANKRLESFQKTAENARIVEKQANDIDALADKYDKLGMQSTLLGAAGVQGSEGQREFERSVKDLAKAVPEAVTELDEYDASGRRIGTRMVVNTDVARVYTESLREQARAAKEAAEAQLDAEAQDVGRSYIEAKDKLTQFGAARKQLQENIKNGSNEGVLDGLLGGFDAKTQLKITTAQFAEQKKLIEEQRPGMEKLIDGYQEMGFSAEEIATKLGFSADQMDRGVAAVKEYKGQLDGTVITSKDLESAIAGLPESQQLSVRAVANLTEGYAQAQDKVDELGAKIQDARSAGNAEMAKSLEKELDEAQKVADEKKLKLQTKLDDKEVKEGLDKLPKEAQAKLQPLRQELKVVADDKAMAETQQKAGTILSDIAELQKSQSKAATEETRKIYDDKILAKQQEFKSNLEKQATTIGNNTARMEELRAQKEKATDPKEVERLRGEIATLERKTADASKQFGQTAAQGQKVGALKGDLRQLATEFSKNERASQGVAQAEKQITNEAANAADAIGNIGDEFKNSLSSASNAVAGIKGELAGYLARAQSAQDAATRQQFLDLYNLKLKEAQGAVKTLIDAQKLEEQVNRDIGVSNLNELRNREKEAADRRKREREQRLAAIREGRAFAISEKAERDRAAAQEIDDELSRSLKLIEIDRREKVAQANLDLKSATDEAGRVKARNAITAATTDAERKRADAIRKFEADAGKDLLKLQADLANQRIQEYRDAATVITGEDVRSIEERARLLRAGIEEENRIRAFGIIEGQPQVIKAIQERSATEISAVTAATRELSTAEENAQNKLADARAQRAQEMKTNPGLQPLTPEEEEKILRDSGLLIPLETARTKLQEAQTDLRTKFSAFSADVLDALKVDPDKRDEAQQALIATLRLTPEQLQQITGQVQAAERAAVAGLASLKTDTDQKLETARMQARLASITDSAERERLQRQIEGRKTLEAELRGLDNADIELNQKREELVRRNADLAARRAAVGFIETDETIDEQGELNRLALEISRGTDKIERRRLDVRERYAALNRALEREARRDSDQLYAASLSLQENLTRGFFAKVDGERRKDLEKQRSDLEEQSELLIAKLRDDEIAIDAFFSQREDLLQKQKELSDELAGSTRSFWENVLEGVEMGFKSLEESQRRLLDNRIADLDASFATVLEKVEDTGKITGANLDKLGEKMGEVAKASAGVIVGVWAQMAASGKATLGDFADAAIVTSLRTIRTVIEGHIVEIVAAAFAINPLIGILSIPAVLAVEVMLAKWESDAQSRLGSHGFHGGGYTGDGDEWEEAGPVHKREFVHAAAVTAIPINRALFEFLHAGGTEEEWIDRRMGVLGYDDLHQLVVDIDGRLQTSSVAAEALARQVALMSESMLREPSTYYVGVDGELRSRIAYMERASAAAQAAMQHGNNYEAYHRTETYIAVERETAQAVREQTGVMRGEFELLRQQVETTNRGVLMMIKEQQTNNTLIGKHGHGRNSIADQLADLIKRMVELERKLK